MAVSSDLLIKEFPTLYKLTATGAVQFWALRVEQRGDTGVLITTYGQCGTASPQETTDIIAEGKNPGKKNATTAVEQALKEGESQWLKKKKKGYVETPDAAKNGHVDTAVIEGGVSPMLAEKFSEQGHKIAFPCYGQPKLDGARCVAVISGGKATLWTRTRKPIKSVPHIVQALEQAFPTGDIVLDGELYNHALKADFERLMSLVRKDTPGEGHTDVEYHVYDVIEKNTPFEVRLMTLDTLKVSGPIVKVQTVNIQDETDVIRFFEKCRKAGYEGAMLRNARGLYSNRRSPDLQKVKQFDDAEFTVIGLEEGRGRLAGHAGSFVCEMPDGTTFSAKLCGDIARLKTFFENPEMILRRRLVVQYQGLTGGGVPRFPIGVRFRDSDDF